MRVGDDADEEHAMSRLRSFKPFPIFVVLLALAAAGAVTLLTDNADAGRRAQLRSASLTLALTDLQAAPFAAGDSPVPVLPRITADEAELAQGLSRASNLQISPASLGAARLDLRRIDSAAARIYAIASSPAGLGNFKAPTLQTSLTTPSARLQAVLKRGSLANAARARRAKLMATVGTVVAILMLAGVFLIFYVRGARARAVAERLVHENELLLEASRLEASTDALTGIGNRRALNEHLVTGLAAYDGPPELLLAMFDLNGFKQYNDTFGHGAGDALLSRLGGCLAVAVGDSGTAYRMGGDEFCVLARCSPESAETLLARASSALSNKGEGWSIDCSYGAVWAPSEAADPSEALLIADRRMYANKTSRSSASRQITDVLLQVLSEQDKRLDDHVSHVSELSGIVAHALDQPEHEEQRIRLAARLHDIGKTAIPDAILNRPGPLTEHEWEFMRRHTLIGERIVLAAPALASTAPLIRSSHERYDGTGYPDGLARDEIPIGARIIAVCDAFDAMTSSRPYRTSVTADAAFTELRRCAGAQFDPRVVDVFCDVAASRPTAWNQGHTITA
jgi:diguanylate cyclase (GGDEF)-like protein